MAWNPSSIGSSTEARIAADGGAAADALGLPAVEHVLCLAAGMLAGTASLACGAMLAARRLSGSIERLPGPVGLLAVCGTGILLIAISDAAARITRTSRASCSRSGPGGRLATYASRIGLVIALAAVAAPSFGPPDAAGRLPSGRAATLAAVVAAAFAVLGPFAAGRLGTAIRDRRQARADPSPAAARVVKAAHAGDDADARANDEADPLPGRLLQRFERYALPDQSDCLRGRLSLTVPAGARAAHGHVGFCPPFAETPAVDVTTDCDSIEAMVSAAEILPWGVRVECRLDEPAEEAFEIPVDLVARSPAVRPLPSP
jgi:hypothetical protein